MLQSKDKQNSYAQHLTTRGCTNSLDKEFLKMNQKFLPVKMGVSIEIWGDCAEERKTKTIVPEYIIGETKNYWFFEQNGEHFTIHKDNCQNPYTAIYSHYGTTDFNLLNAKLSGRKIMKHQEEAINFLLTCKKGFLLDEQGLGKTLSSIGAAVAANAKKILIVTLASTKINWKREIAMWGEHDVQLLIGGKQEFDMSAKWTVINYDILDSYQTLPKRGESKKEKKTFLTDMGFDCVIADECHKVKHLTSSRSKVFRKITEIPTVKYVFGLSGTLIEKNEELYHICNAFSMDVFPIVLTSNNYRYDVKRTNYDEYRKTYCGAFQMKKNGKSFFVSKSNTNTDSLAVCFRPYVLRRNVKEVLPEFIDLNEYEIYCSLKTKEQKEYANVYENYLLALEEKGIKRTQKDGEEAVALSEKMVEMLKLRQYLAVTKIPHTINFLKNTLDSDEKAIIFTHFAEEYDTLLDSFGDKAVGVHASMTAVKIQKQIDSFQTDSNIKYIVGNIQTLGTGHNITKGDYVVHNSPDWNSGEILQGNSRAYRMGREGDVNSYYMLFSGTVEEEVFNRAMSKKDNREQFYLK